MLPPCASTGVHPLESGSGSVDELLRRDGPLLERQRGRGGAVHGEVQPCRDQHVRQQLLQLAEIVLDVVREQLHPALVTLLDGQVQRDPQAGEGRPQLVRHVGQELLLGTNQPGGSFGHVVERPAQLAELIGTIHPRAGVQASRPEASGDRGE